MATEVIFCNKRTLSLLQLLLFFAFVNKLNKWRLLRECIVHIKLMLLVLVFRMCHWFYYFEI